MRIWSYAAAWQLFLSGFVSVSILSPVEAHAAIAHTVPSTESEMLAPRVAARPLSSDHRPRYHSATRSEADHLNLRSHVGEARRTLTSLRAFIEEALETAELGDQLRIRRSENNRLKESLVVSQNGNDALENELGTTHAIVSALTKAVVRNWLLSARLDHRYDKARNDLDASETSRLTMQRRIATLRQSLLDTRTELIMLRAKGVAINAELGRLRREIVERKAYTIQLERQRSQILADTASIRRHVTRHLRAVILNGKDE